jgi:uncharacterized membrane protein (DUF373 family)
MRLLDQIREEWQKLDIYERFEEIAYVILLIFIALMVVHSLIFFVVKLWREVLFDVKFGEAALLKDTFGGVLTIVLLLEFNRSILAALRARSGVVELRIVVEIAILAIARKLILFDYEKANLEMPLFLGALILALGALYWLLGHAEQARRSGGAPPG